MARTELKVVVANKGKVIVPTGFKGYDVCINSYVGCEFGCRYCYVRFFITDDERPWGEFVRVRKHIEDKLPRELEKGYITVPDGKRPKVKDGQPVLRNGKQVMETINRRINNEDLRLVLGTMTDPYQPIERKHRITRTILKTLLETKTQLNKVGIFTRSPIVLDDLDLIVKLPRKRVHYTVTPYTPEVMKLIEPIAIMKERRFDTIRTLKEAGVRIHVNVSPAMPVVSEQFTEEYANTLAEMRVEQFYVDPLQPYGEAWAAIEEVMKDHPSWKAIEEIVLDKEAFQDWKDLYKARWLEAWGKVKHKSTNTLAIWSDHVSGTWVDMNTDKQMDHKWFGDDLENN